MSAPRSIVPALILALCSVAPSQAGSRAGSNAFQDTAWVVASTPVYEKFNEPRRECWDEQVGYDYPDSVRGPDRNIGGAILGGILGGVLGHSVGKGDGRRAATAIGAITGAVAGDKYDNNRPDLRGEPIPRIEQRCRNVDNWSRKLSGYNVTYRYQGHEYDTFLPYDPGRSVRVNVDVSLAER